MTTWAEAVDAAGHEVHLVGRVVPTWPPADPLYAESVHTLTADGLPLLRSFEMSATLGKATRDLAPDIVHAHWLPEFGWMAAREGLRPLVCSAWGSDVLRPGLVGRRRSVKALRAAEMVMADSVHLAQAAAALAGRDVRVEVVRPGLNLDHFSPGDSSKARRAVGLPEDRPLVVGIRPLSALYNPGLVLEAFAQIHARRPDALLLLKHPQAGIPEVVRTTIERLGLTDAVITLGNVTADKLPDVYRAADVIVSIASSDSSPRSVWEALACARPVVVSDLPWARDELSPGENALVAPLDAESVSVAISRVLDDEELAARLGQAGRALAVAELDPQVCSSRIDVLYRSLVESGR